MGGVLERVHYCAIDPKRGKASQKFSLFEQAGAYLPNG